MHGFSAHDESMAEEIVFTQREMYLCLLQEYPVKIPAFTFRRTVLEDVGYLNESWPSGSDWDFLLRFSKRHRFGYIDDPLAVVRLQADATHRVHAVADKSCILGMLREEFRRAPDSAVRRVAKTGYRDTVRHLSWEYLQRGQKLNASVALARGFPCYWTGGLAGEIGLRACQEKNPSGNLINVCLCRLPLPGLSS